MTFPPIAIPFLCQFILAAVISGYLATLKGPTRATRYLLASFLLQAAWATMVIAYFVTASSESLLIPQYVLGIFIYWTLLLFCYSFLEDPFQREYRAAKWSGLGLSAGVVIVGALFGPMTFQVSSALLMTVLAAWTLIVVVRKAREVGRRDQPGLRTFEALLRPPSRPAAAHRILLLPIFLGLALIVARLLVHADLIAEPLYHAFLRVAALLVLILLVLILLTYGQERHSVQIKLVGTALTIVLAVLGIVSMIVIEPIEGPEAARLGGSMALVTIGAAVVTVIVIPLAFRASLIGPLKGLREGIRRVDEGHLDVLVPVLVQDEIGEVTRTFNEMTLSLHAYSNRMETLVEERTRELEQSLRELRTAQDQLVQQEKMASLGSLTAGIAHEIKNPLNFVNNFAELTQDLVSELFEEADDDPDLRVTCIRDVLEDLQRNASRIVEHGRRADSIVRSMLMHSRGGSGERQSTDLNSLVDEYANLAFHGMRAQQSDFNCTIERDYDAAIESIKIVPQDIGRVLLNLFNNAFYATAEKARTVNGRGHESVVRVRTRAIQSGVEIRIRDNGPGIPDAVRARIFEPFFTTKPTGEGTGLGLSMSHDIVVKGHGGSFDVESRPGVFTEFIIVLPWNAPGLPPRVAGEPARSHL